MARVSVIIPTYNRPQRLARAIQSVADQTYRDVEVIVVENGGARLAEQVVDGFRGRLNIRYIYNARPGAAQARNIGLRHATGRYIALLDDDDEWLPEKLERQVTVLEQHPDVGLVSCAAQIIDDVGNVVSEYGHTGDELSFRQLIELGCRIPSCSSVVIRRVNLDGVGWLNTKYKIVDDYDLYLRLAATCRLFFVRKPLFRYRLHAGNTSKQESRMWQEYLQILQNVRPSPRHGVTRQHITAAKSRIQKHHYSLATQAMKQRDYRKARQIFWQAVCLDPFIGLKLPWGRFRNPVYRVTRPYIGSLWCGLAAWSSTHE